MHSCSHPEPQDQKKASGQLHALADALPLEEKLLVVAEQARCILEPRWRKETLLLLPTTKGVLGRPSVVQRVHWLLYRPIYFAFYYPSKQPTLFSKQLSYWKA